MIQEASFYPDEDEGGFLQRKKKIDFFLIEKENLVMIQWSYEEECFVFESQTKLSENSEDLKVTLEWYADAG